jgi:hypothetical protein
MVHYRVRVQRGDSSIEVESSDKAFVDGKLAQLGPTVGIDLGASRGRGGGERKARELPPRRTPSLAEHVRTINPTKGTQYVIAVGNWLELFGGKGNGFKTRDLSSSFKVVKFRHSNPAEAVRQARSQGWLMDGHDSGSLQLTQSALDWIQGQLAAE